MRAVPPNPKAMNSDPTPKTFSELPDLLVENTLDDGLCPSKVAIRNELQALGIRVSEVDRLLHSGDLKNAEKALGSIFERLTESFCPASPTSRDWVRERSGDVDCDLLHSHAPTYLLTVPSPAQTSMEARDESSAGSDKSGIPMLNRTGEHTRSRSSLFGELLDQAMRF